VKSISKQNTAGAMSILLMFEENREWMGGRDISLSPILVFSGLLLNQIENKEHFYKTFQL